MPDPDLEAAWSEIHAAVDGRPGWFVGRPAYEPHGALPWSQYATDRFAEAKVGLGARESTAPGTAEVACLREMPRCLREISQGRVPE